LTDAAAQAWANGDAREAASFAERAIERGAGQDAREILARSALVYGENERAIGALSGTTDPVLLRLRARAQMALDRYDEAVMSLEAAQRYEREGDPWAEAVLPAARAARDAERVYAVTGERAELELLDAPLPLVRVRADTAETIAVIGTGADLTVVDPSIRAAGGAIDELALGDLRIASVPFIARSLEAISAAIGQPVGMVIGADLLVRLHATVDGPRRRLLVYGEGPPRGVATSAILLTPSASSLAVEITIGERRAWMTIDTAGLFPIALGPDAATALELTSLEWARTAAGPLAIVPSIRIGDLAAEGIPAVDGMLGDEHARAVGAPVAGSIGWMVLEQMAISFDGRQLRFD
jgi:hypothetical protein